MPISLEDGTDSLKETSLVKGSKECHSEYLRAVDLVLLKNINKHIHKSQEKKERKKDFRKSASTLALNIIT